GWMSIGTPSLANTRINTVPWRTPPNGQLSSCGTAPTFAAGSTDAKGIINVGSGSPTSCTFTFTVPFWTAPQCTLRAVGGTGAISQWTVSPTQLQISNTAPVNIAYDCDPNGSSGSGTSIPPPPSFDSLSVASAVTVGTNTSAGSEIINGPNNASRIGPAI